MSKGNDNVVPVGFEGREIVRQTKELFPQHMQGQVDFRGLQETAAGLLKPVVRLTPDRPSQMMAASVSNTANPQQG
jgi:hypothetical protein